MPAHVIFALIQYYFMKRSNFPVREQGLTLIELMVAMAISLMIVAAAAFIYLRSSQSQRALERQNSSLETGNYVMQLLGREILNAGFYPASALVDTNDPIKKGMYDTYPPLQSDPRIATDWQNTAAAWPPIAYMTGIYGCDGGVFNVNTATCPVPDASKADTIVVNYFTSDAMGLTGTRRDCTGADVGLDSSNINRKINTSGDSNQPPKMPLFVSNRYTLSELKNYVDGGDLTTRSLGCSGNGANPFGTVSLYQPMVAGLKDMKFRYGVYVDENSTTPARFYTAAEVSALPDLVVLGQSYTGWQRITAVRVCLLSQSLGDGVRLSDASGGGKTYLDCNDSAQNQPSGQFINRFVQVFGVRNGLKQSY